MPKKTKDWFMYALAAFWLLGSFVLFFLLAEREQTATMIGIIDTLKFTDILVLTYFFGTSKSSADKNEMLANSTPITPTKE